jgi:hypothetical protein
MVTSPLVIAPRARTCVTRNGWCRHDPSPVGLVLRPYLIDRYSLPHHQHHRLREHIATNDVLTESDQWVIGLDRCRGNSGVAKRALARVSNHVFHSVGSVGRESLGATLALLSGETPALCHINSHTIDIIYEIYRAGVGRTPPFCGRREFYLPSPYTTRAGRFAVVAVGSCPDERGTARHDSARVVQRFWLMSGVGERPGARTHQRPSGGLHE